MLIQIPFHVGETVIDLVTGNNVKVLGVRFSEGIFNGQYYCSCIGINTDNGMKNVTELKSIQHNTNNLVDLHAI